MKEEVRDIIERFDLVKENSKVVVSVSGGPDSVALLCVLAQIKEELNFYLHVAHLNHGFRDKSAEEDAEFVKGLAKKLNLPFTIKRWNVKRYVKVKGISTQQGARKLRYRFLQRVADKQKADTIAMGHNRDDQVETFLLRLFRGSGLEGLSGIPIKRKLNESKKDIYVIRPLLYTSRERIENYLKDLGQSYKIDPTNKKTVYMRNKVRLELIPWLEEFNPNFKNQVFETTELLARDNEYLKNKAQELFNRVKYESRPGYVSLDYSKMKKEHEAVLSRVLTKGVYIASKGKRLEKKHVEYINEMLLDKIEGPITLPGNTKVDKRENTLIFDASSKSREEGFEKFYCTSLTIPGKTYWKPLNCYIEAALWENSGHLLYYEKPEEAFLDYDKLNAGIKVRTREKGDRFHPLGMNKEKKLKDFLIDLKITSELRDKLPLVISGKDVVWVAPYRISEKYKVTDETNRVLHLRLLREDENDQNR